MVASGSLIVRLRDRDLDVGQGQFVITPRGVDHLPIAQDELHVVLVELNCTVNTGDQVSERTARAERIYLALHPRLGFTHEATCANHDSISTTATTS